MNPKTATVEFTIGSDRYQPIYPDGTPAEPKLHDTGAGQVIFWGDVKMKQTSYTAAGDESTVVVFRDGGYVELRVPMNGGVIHHRAVGASKIDAEPLGFMAAGVTLRKI